MTLLQVAGLVKRFDVGGGRRLHAVDDVSFEIASGESLGLVGESGSGKSTIARLVTRLIDPDEGEICYDGRDVGNVKPGRFARDPARREIQLVFQSSDDALNPAMTTAQNIAVGRGVSWGARKTDIAAIADEVGLSEELIVRRPNQLSGGQQARAGIARALISNPRLLVLDEPTASLDVSVQGSVLKLVDRIRRERGLALLFVSHDLDVIRLMCGWVVVLYLGRVVEIGPVADIMTSPCHPYTRALVAATPGKGGAASLTGEAVSPIDPPREACLFHTRCRWADERCRNERPQLGPVEKDEVAGWQVACHHAKSIAG